MEPRLATTNGNLPALAAMLAAVFFVFPLTLNHPLLDPDEGLRAAIAQEMVERGDWLVPRFLGQPFLDNPAFYFWIEALSLWLFGMNEAAVRLPGLLFGLAGAAATGLLGRRLLGPGHGWLAAILYMSMFLPTALAQAAAPDVALVVWVVLAIVLLWELDTHRGAWRAAVPVLALGLVFGLMLITKGLVGVALVGVAFAGRPWWGRRGWLGLCGRAAVALLLGAALAGCWFAAVEVRNPGYLHYFFVERHFFGFATNSQLHSGEPWWYYLPVLLVGGLPWVSYLPAVLRDLSQRRAAAASLRPQLVLLLCWLLGCTLVLSLARSKLVTYFWPVFPAVAMLAAIGWRRLLDGELAPAARQAFGRMLAASCLTAPIAFPLAILVAQAALEVRLPWTVWPWSVVAGLAAWPPLWFWRRGQTQRVLAAATLAVAVQFAVLMTVAMPSVAAALSAPELAAHYNRLGQVPPLVRTVEERVGSLIFYLDPPMRQGLQPDQLRRVRSHELAWLTAETVLVVPERRVARAEKKTDLSRRRYEVVGRHRIYGPAEPPPAVCADGG
jgi:4-amino-4-deoxy-L-arabinose transferase-like glycosyltransferase